MRMRHDGTWNVSQPQRVTPRSLSTETVSIHQLNNDCNALRKVVEGYPQSVSSVPGLSRAVLKEEDLQSCSRSHDIYQRHLTIIAYPLAVHSIVMSYSNYNQNGFHQPHEQWNSNTPSHLYKPSPYHHDNVSLSIQQSTSRPLRSFQELTNERAYLLSSLQLEDQRATDLLKTVARLHDLTSGLHGHRLKQARKQLAHYKRQLTIITNQEKAVLARLGEVTHEIQWQERFAQLEHERRLAWEMYSGFERMQLDSHAQMPALLPPMDCQGYVAELPAEVVGANHLDDVAFSCRGRSFSLGNATEDDTRSKKRLSAPIVSSTFIKHSGYARSAESGSDSTR